MYICSAELFLFKFQYDNTLRALKDLDYIKKDTFKFQYDNTLRSAIKFFVSSVCPFKFQYDNTLRIVNLKEKATVTYLNSNMIIL